MTAPDYLGALTPRQEDMLRFIAAHVEQHGYPPTVREIGEVLQMRSTNAVHEQLCNLERNGWLTWKDRKSRTLQVLRLPQAPAQARA